MFSQQAKIKHLKVEQFAQLYLKVKYITVEMMTHLILRIGSEGKGRV